MPKALEDCVKQVKADIAAGKTQVRKDKSAEETAYAICNATVGESVRHFKDGNLFLSINPETFELTRENEIPADQKVLDITEVEDTSSNPAMMQPTEHDHPHAHGTLNHSHPHQHDKEHGIDGQMGKHDHPHADEENPAEDKGEEPGEDKKKESTRMLIFGEQVSLRESVVDKAKKTVEVTLIKPGWSANGRFYSKEVLAASVPLFEGTKAFADHPSKFEDDNRPERSVKDITGYYANVRQAEDGSLRATRHFVGKGGEEVYPLVLEAIANKPDLVGLSINAAGMTSIGEAEGKTGQIVEKLVKSFSVDDVTVASAGGKYERLMQSGDEMTAALIENMTYEQWRSNSEFEARLKKEMRTARKEELESVAVKEAETLRETLKTKDDAISENTQTITKLNEAVTNLEQKLADKDREAESRVKAVLADLKLLESKLPKEWCESIKPTLLTAEDMDKVIETEKKKFFANREPVQVKHAGAGDSVDYRDPKVVGVLEALGVNSEIYPRDDESPEEYAARKRKLRG